MAKPITPEQLAKSGSEDGEQAALFCWAAQSGLTELRWLFAIPNGGSRHIAEAAKLRATGVKRGVPDICLPVPKGNWHGLWIELKKIKVGIVSDDQSKWLEYLAKQGYATAVCFGWLEAKERIMSYLLIAGLPEWMPQDQKTTIQYG